MTQLGLLATPVPPPAQAGRYRTLYPDPPWPEHGGGQIKRGADRHYDLMTVPEIVALFATFGTWAAADAHLYTWVTNNYLPAAFECIRAAGFRFVTAVTWVKARTVDVPVCEGCFLHVEKVLSVLQVLVEPIMFF